MRLFVAAILPEEIRGQVSNHIDLLSSRYDGVKWEKPEKLHITLKFLGDVDDSQAKDIAVLLKKLALSYISFNLTLKELGGFPNLKKPRILYIGLSKNTQLSKFVNELEKQLAELGFEKEARKFIPHITIGRVKKRINIQDMPQLIQSSFNANDIGLIKSELCQSGSVYRPIYIHKLEK